MQYTNKVALTEPIRLTRSIDISALIPGGDGIMYQFVTDASGSQLTHIVAGLRADPHETTAQLEPSQHPGVAYEVHWNPSSKQRSSLLDALDAIDVQRSIWSAPTP